MKNVAVSDMRNFSVLGHRGSGKTTLVDALLYKLGVNDRLGSVDDGSSLSDWTDAEKQRKISIQAKSFSGTYKSASGKQMDMVFCDTPGYMDFYGQVIAATGVSDAVLILIDATAGIETGTARVWKRATQLNLPRAIVISGIDRENANYKATLESIQSTWGQQCVPVVVPSADGSSVVDIMASKDTPDGLAVDASAFKESIVEIAAETDDTLIEKYLAGEDLSATEIANGLRDSVNAASFVPVFACAAKNEVGVSELLEGISNLLPSPADRKVEDTDGNEIDTSAGAPLRAFVWRTVNDPYVGQLTIVRVYGGTLTTDTDITNITQGQKEKPAALMYMKGKEHIPVTEAGAGEIVALAKLKNTKLSDTLCGSGATGGFPPLEFPSALVSYAVRAKSRNDEDKIGTALQRLEDDDPTIRISHNKETHELVLSGMGDVHIDVAVAQMKARSNVEVDLSMPKVPYRETVTVVAEGHHKHKKQSGGHGQYGEVYLRVDPLPEGEEDWFVNKIVGGAIPSNFFPAVQKGLVEGMTAGAVAGYPVTGVRVTLYDGTFHDVDSSEVAFKIASSRALREAMGNAKPVLLEPVMVAKIAAPDQYMGDINGDLSQKRGHILGMSLDSGVQVIEAEVPLAEMSHYIAELRSMTSGQGTFEMEFSRYDVVPSNVEQKVVAASKKAAEEG